MRDTTSPSTLLARALHFVPAFGALRGYRWHDARADTLAGLTVAAVAVPQAMAYATVAGLPPQYGLYTAIIMTAVGALLASSRQLINGPTNAISIAVLSVVATIPDADAKVQAVILLTFMVGAIQVLITVLRLGDLTRYISHSVIIGFTLGAGALIVIDQFKNLLGLHAVGDVHDHFLYRFWRTLAEGGDVHWPTLAIGVTSMVLVVALRKLKSHFGLRFLPELLVVVVVMAALVAWLDLARHGVKVIGTVPADFPNLQLPTLDASMMRDLATGALAIAVLGLLEAIAMAKAISAQTQQKLDINQQCLSEGVANVAGSLFQCMPGSGSLTRSAINFQAGAVSQWSGVVSAVAVALVMVAFAAYAHYIPRAALAGILIVAAWKMIDWHAVAYHLRATRFDAAIVGATAFSAVVISIEFCVLIGILMSFVLTVPRAGRMQRTEFIVAEQGGIHERLPQDHPHPRMLIFGFEGELFFGAATFLEHHLRHIEGRLDDNTRVLVLRMKRLRNPDAVGLAVLESFLERMKTRGVHIILCGVRVPMFETMKRAGVARLLDDKHVFLEQPVRETSTLLAVRYAYQLIGESDAGAARTAGQASDGQPRYYSV
jgi:SulP family sulfate permease